MSKQKNSLKIPKKIPCLLPVDLSFHPHIIAESTNNFAEENNLQWCPDLSGPHLCNVGPWQTDNFYEENNLYNVVSTMLVQHCIGILSIQCCPNMSERTLHKKITSAMLVQSTQTHFPS